MPTVAELDLLHRAMGDLGDTLGRNRALRQQERQHADRNRLEAEMLGLRREELGQRRADRAEDLRRDDAGAAALQKYRDAMVNAKSEGDRLAVFQDLLKSGAATQETLDRMAEAMSQKLGVKVSLKMPEGDAVKYDEDPVTGERTARFGKTFRGSGRNPEKDYGTLTEEPDPLTGDVKRRVTRTLKKGDLDDLMRRDVPADEDMTGMERPFTEEELKQPGIPAHGPPPGVAAAPSQSGDRVTVISPGGKRGSIPKAQLAEALKQGYKLAQ